MSIVLALVLCAARGADVPPCPWCRPADLADVPPGLPCPWCHVGNGCHAPDVPPVPVLSDSARKALVLVARRTDLAAFGDFPIGPDFPAVPDAPARGPGVLTVARGASI
jgi:hypothetical protein